MEKVRSQIKSDQHKPKKSPPPLESYFKNIVEKNSDAIIVVNMDGIVLFANKASALIFDLKNSDLIGTKFGFPLASDQVLEVDIFRANNKPGVAEMCAEQIDWHDDAVYLVTIRDITERKHAEERIAKSLQEKELLLKEIHHRVKNNMQIISGLINLQFINIEDTRLRSLFTVTQNRIRSVSLVHEQLYQSHDIGSLDMADFMYSLTSNLYQSLQVDHDTVKFIVNVESILVNIDTAIPCALIINELLTNAIKYAFPNGRKGNIMISIKAAQSDIALEIADDGIGFPHDLEIKKLSSLGLQLVDDFTKKLKGKLELNNTGGASFKIIFPNK